MFDDEHASPAQRRLIWWRKRSVLIDLLANAPVVACLAQVSAPGREQGLGH